MIALSDAAKMQFSHLVTPPTHAKIVWIKHCDAPASLPLNGGMKAMLHGPSFEAVYALGTLDSTGAFRVCPFVEPVHTALDLTQYAPKDPPTPTPPSLNETAAQTASREAMDAQVLKAYTLRDQMTKTVANLFGAGVSPTPGAPHIPQVQATKPAGEYRYSDADAAICYFEARLLGTVFAG